MTDSELDALLKTPLEPAADAGFSRAVAAKIAAEGRAIAWFEGIAAVVLGVLVLVFVPWGRLAAPFENLAFDLGLSVPFAIACAAIALSHMSLRLFAEE